METVNDKLKEHGPIKLIEIKPGIPFTANGRTYTPSDTFTIGRFEKVEELESELVMFSDNKSCHDIMLKAMEHINKYQPGEAYMLLYNKIDTDQRNAKVTHYTLRLCAAYINFEGEDLRYLTDETIQKKINDWSEEGLDIRPFLVFAVSVCRELFQRYKLPIQNILTEAKEIRESLTEVLDIKSLTANSGPAK